MPSDFAEHFFHDHPELRAYVLPNMHPTGITLGTGAYCIVEEVEMNGTLCAAKSMHQILASTGDFTKKFVATCKLLSTLHHPHIVQFLGLGFRSGLELPSLVMEHLLTDLHDLLEQDTPHDAPYFPLNLKCSILHDVASGLCYLHERSPPVIHSSLTARDILLNSSMAAKIGGFQVAQVVGSNTPLVMIPGPPVYMAPEAMVPSSSTESDTNVEYGVAIDIFSFGIVAILTLTHMFPYNILPPTYVDHDSGNLIVRTELERRGVYMKKVYNLLRKDHPLVRMIELCLHNDPDKRPGVRELLYSLEESQAEVRDVQSNMNKLELIQSLQTKQVNSYVQCSV